MERVLCVKIASRGDLLMASPAFARLRAERPEALLTLMVGRSCADVAGHLDFFDNLEIVDDRELFQGNRLAQLRSAWKLIQVMRGYSEVLVFHRDWRYSFLAWLGGAPVRRGLARGREGRFLTHPYAAATGEHDVAQYLNLIAALPRGTPPLPSRAAQPLEGHWSYHDGEREAALATATEHGFQPAAGPWVGLGFGGGNNVKTRTSLKCWPVENFRQLARRLTEAGYRVAWVGDAEDARALGAEFEGVGLAGKLSVVESAAVLGSCELVVANDTLNLHLAEIQGVPTVGIFGPTNPAHYRPLGPRSRHLWMGPAAVPCTPCHQDGFFPECAFFHRCMTGIAVEEVFASAVEILDPSRLPVLSRSDREA